jgi:hypothetical protein
VGSAVFNGKQRLKHRCRWLGNILGMPCQRILWLTGGGRLREIKDTRMYSPLSNNDMRFLYISIVPKSSKNRYSFTCHADDANMVTNLGDLVRRKRPLG